MVMSVDPRLPPCKGKRTTFCWPGRDLEMSKCRRVAAVSVSLLPNELARTATARHQY
ncbi:Hypothetical predicted protein [Lynx pardinus]|uniref:Uncharacterized protein n=1 Tax=Lynx pardinus TaxID=191816 RepID=A0A485PE23_LYNPA|nr:Hypothetical predicted protein [Lynx pardinus]